VNKMPEKKLDLQAIQHQYMSIIKAFTINKAKAEETLAQREEDFREEAKQGTNRFLPITRMFDDLIDWTTNARLLDRSMIDTYKEYGGALLAYIDQMRKDQMLADEMEDVLKVREEEIKELKAKIDEFKEDYEKRKLNFPGEVPVNRGERFCLGYGGGNEAMPCGKDITNFPATSKRCESCRMKHINYQKKMYDRHKRKRKPKNKVTPKETENATEKDDKVDTPKKISPISGKKPKITEIDVS